MSYDAVKNGIANLLKALGYTESTQATDFKHASAHEYGNRYIIKNLSGENQEDTIVDRFYDAQEWQVQIAFERSEQNDVLQLDALHRAKDALLIKLDKPANWSGIAQMLKYASWTVVEAPNYYILDVRLSVLDSYIY